MIAFDTNLLVRLAVADNPKQTAIVQKLIAQDVVFIPRTVILEAEWAPPNCLTHWTGTGKAQILPMRCTLPFAATAVLHTFDKGFCKAAWEAQLTPEFVVLDG